MYAYTYRITKKVLCLLELDVVLEIGVMPKPAQASNTVPIPLFG